MQQLLFFLSLGCLLVSFYLQYGLQLIPCPLCLMQRFCAFLIMLTTFIALIRPRFSTKKSYWMLQCLWIGAGLFFVARQLWLQSLPAEQVPACMPALQVLLAYFPWSTVFKALFWGAASCAEVKFHLWGFSLAAWSGLYFLLSFVLLIIIARK